METQSMYGTTREYALQLPFPAVWPLLLGVLAVLLYQRRNQSTFPIVNSYPWDFARRKAYKAYVQNARGLIAEGFAKFQGPFQIYTPNGLKLVLPSSHMDWAKSSKDLDHQQLVHQDYFASFSGFEGQEFVTNPNRLLIDVVRSKLSQNPHSISLMDREADLILNETWTDNREWHSLDWAQDTIRVISRMSASIFVGLDLARNEEWQKLTVSYTVNIFGAVAALRKWPAFLRPIVHQFLPESNKCREQVRRARRMMQTILANRAHEQEAAISRGESPEELNDCITWMKETAAGRPFDPAAGQLALAISALHTTTEAFRQVLLDLCVHQDLIQQIRDEIGTVLGDGELTLAALAKMELLDSVLKESQRLVSASVGVERRVIHDTALPDGTRIPQGSNICVDSADMWSPEVHNDPQRFDGYRFLRMRTKGGKSASAAAFVSSTKEHNTFGAGRFICPGRFFVANEMKIALVHVLSKYDIRLEAPEHANYFRSGFYGMTNLQARVEVRRRSGQL